MLTVALTAIATLAMSGCAMRMGPRAVTRDRFNYGATILDSWQQQMLVNMVRMRYAEPPAFLEVNQVVTSYSLDGTATVAGPGWRGETSPPLSLGGVTGHWSENPTITYNPLFGEKFTKDLLQPIPPIALLSLIQAGWPADIVLGVGARSINGIHAGSRTQVMHRSGDPDFSRLLALLQQLQAADNFGVQVEQSEGGVKGTISIQQRPGDEAINTAKRTVGELLKLDPEAQEYTIAFGALPKNNKEIAFTTRSMLGILAQASGGVEVPPGDAKEGRVTATGDQPDSATEPRLMVRVRCTEHSPTATDAFVAVKYRNHWFWVDDRDIPSKRGLGFLMILFTLVESGGTAAPPVLTISK